MASGSIQEQIEELYSNISKKYLPVYKSYHTQYFRWLKSHGLISGSSSSSSSSTVNESGAKLSRHSSLNGSDSDSESEGNKDKDKDGAFVLSDFIKDLPLTPQLVHWFLLEKVILDNSVIGQKLILLKQYVESFNLLHKIRTLYLTHDNGDNDNNNNRNNNLSQIGEADLERESRLFERYLSRIINIHTSWQAFLDTYSETKLGNPIFPNYFIVSINVWNSNAKRINMRTIYERFRFLADFHIATYTKMTFQQRSKMKLNNLLVNDPNSLIINYVYNNEMSHSLQIANLIPQDCPFLCPFTSLATYLFLRFYGVPNRAAGDGFPDLLDKTVVDSLTLVKGRQAMEYSSDGTLHLAYMKIFKYCNVPYKRRTYFEYPKPRDNCFLEYTQSEIDDFFTNFHQLYPRADVTPSESGLFDDKVPVDFERVLNYRDPYSVDDHINITEVNEYFNRRKQTRPPNSVLTRFFPEIEFYKEQSKFEKLTQNAKNILQLIQMLRLIFVGNLPTIYKVFPDHQLFEHRLFSNYSIRAYLNNSLASEAITNRLLPLIQFQNLTIGDFYKHLVEVPPGVESSIGALSAPDSSMPQMSPITVRQSIESPQQRKRRRLQNTPETVVSTTPTPISPPPPPQQQRQYSFAGTSLNEDQISNLKGQNFQYVQYQTLSNFKTLLSLLHRVFGEIKMKRSERVKVMSQLEALSNSIMSQISSTTPQDVGKYFMTNEGMSDSSKYDDFIEGNDKMGEEQELRRSTKWGIIYDSSDDKENADREEENSGLGRGEKSYQKEIEDMGHLKQRKRGRRKKNKKKKQQTGRMENSGKPSFKLGSILGSSDEERDSFDDSEPSSANDIDSESLSLSESESESGSEVEGKSESESEAGLTEDVVETKSKKTGNEVSSQDLNALSSLQEELKVLVDEFVSTKVDAIISQKLEGYETKLNSLVNSLVTEKVQAILKPELDSDKQVTKETKTVRRSLDNNLDDGSSDAKIEILQSGRQLAPARIVGPRTSGGVVRGKGENRVVRLTYGRQGLIVGKSRVSSTPMESKTPEKNKTEVSIPSSSSPETLPVSVSSNKFELDPSIDSVEGIVLEWFTPNPLMNNESVQTMNKKHGRSWRSGFETLYKERKLIVELYVHLINREKLDKHRALEACNTMRRGKSMREFSKFLKAWKRRHNNDFNGILNRYGMDDTYR